MTKKKKSLETQKALRFVVSSQIHYLLQKRTSWDNTPHANCKL